MSKLIDSMKEVCLNERKVVMAPLDFNVEERVEDVRTNYETVTRYGFRAEIGMTGFANSTEELRNLRFAARRQLAEFAFGEFRAHIMGVERALHERDLAEALRLLRRMDVEMFKVD